MQNSHYWTNHIYKSNHVKYLSCHIFSPAEPTQAPSTDAIDIDVCSDFLVRNCYLEVNDDAIVLKEGKGPWSDGPLSFLFAFSNKKQQIYHKEWKDDKLNDNP